MVIKMIDLANDNQLWNKVETVQQIDDEKVIVVKFQNSDNVLVMPFSYPVLNSVLNSVQGVVKHLFNYSTKRGFVEYHITSDKVSIEILNKADIKTTDVPNIQ